MNYLLGLINRLVGDEQLTRMLFAAVIGLSVVMVVVALAVLVKGLQSPVQRRLMLIKRGHGIDHRAPPSNLQMMLEQVGQRFSSAETRQASATSGSYKVPACSWISARAASSPRPWR